MKRRVISHELRFCAPLIICVESKIGDTDFKRKQSHALPTQIPPRPAHAIALFVQQVRWLFRARDHRANPLKSAHLMAYVTLEIQTMITMVFQTVQIQIQPTQIFVVIQMAMAVMTVR